jgi:hypothetical protein
VSEASPVTGEGSERRAARKSRGTADDRVVTVAFENGRWRRAGWAGFGLVLGVLLIWQLGVVGQVLGALLLALGGWNAFRFVQTLRHPAGEIAVTEQELRLPHGLCSGGHTVVDPATVEHAYFLRRAVPWAIAGPILVIEAAGKTYSFPRDWFATDADQRRIAHALNRRLGRLP